MNLPASNRVFVFGSNLAGKHGAGAARFALTYHGAIYGQGVGRQGNSYAIPTKGYRMKPLSLALIARHVADFIAYATAHPELRFTVTRIGCGLAGYTDRDIAPFFKGAPGNCELPEGWRELGGEMNKEARA